MSLAIGYFASLVVSAGTIFWALRWLGRVAASALLAGQTEVSRLGSERRTLLARLALPALIVCLLAGIAALAVGGRIDNPMFRALAFFSGVVLTVEGPAELQLLSAERVFFHYGKLRARVLPGAEGFTVGKSLVSVGGVFVDVLPFTLLRKAGLCAA